METVTISKAEYEALIKVFESALTYVNFKTNNDMENVPYRDYLLAEKNLKIQCQKACKVVK